MKNLMCLAIALIFVGCGMKYMSHQDSIQKHAGSSIEDLIALWGAPQSTSPLPSGNTAYLFVSEQMQMEKTGEIRSGVTYSKDKATVDVYNRVTKTCKTSVIADKSGKVISLNSQGDGCQGTWVKEN